MKNSDWAKWAAIAEVLSAVAIVITLLYLAVQTAQNTKALQSGARQASLDSELGVLYKVIDYPVLYKIQSIELSDSNYSKADLARIGAWEMALLRVRESNWMQYQAGALDRETWESYRSVLIDNISNSDRTQKVWELFSGYFDPAFVEEVNRYLQE